MKSFVSRIFLGVRGEGGLDVAADLAAGRLKLVLPTWQGERVPLYFVTAERSESSPILTALREHLLRQLGQSMPATNSDE